MGAFGSKEKTMPTREEMLRVTDNGKYFIEHAFFFMSSQMNMKDFLLMVQPARCGEMIFLTAKALESSFQKYKIAPSRGKDGFIYFQKIDDFKGRCRGQMTESSTYSVCVTIAMFYVRIFQIYGALSLTILDVDPLYYQQLGGAYIGGEEDEIASQKGAYAAEQQGAFLQDGGASQHGAYSALQKGGKLRVDDVLSVDFEILRNYVSITSDENYYKFDGTQYPIYLNRNINPLNDSGAGVTLELPRRAGQRKAPSIEFSLKIEKGPNTYVFLLSDFKGLERDINLLPAEIGRSIRFTKGQGIGSGYTWHGLSIPKALERKVLDIVKNLGISDYKDGARDGDRGDGQRDKEIDRQRYLAGEKGVKEPLQTAALWSIFTDRKYTKSHCVARAIQLVSSAALEKSVPPQIYSSICNEKFLSGSGSLPGAGQSILKEKGIFVLNQLFYDTLNQITPLVGDQTRSKYENLRKVMALVFLNNPDTPINQIADKTSGTYCKDSKKGKTILVRDKALIVDLRNQARDMLLLQISHTAQVVNLLKELFILEKGKPVTLNPKLVEGGLGAVNVVADKARALLVNYYGTCESKYQAGVQMIAKARPDQAGPI
jgi:hypothetical protein